AVTADGAVTADEYALRRWDTAGKEAKQLKLDAATVTELLLSPDGRTLAVRASDGKVQLLDATTGEARATLEGKDRKLSTFQFSADGRWLAALEFSTAAGPGGGPRPRGRAAVGAAVYVYDARS